MQTLDFILGLHNYLEFFQPLSCLYQAYVNMENIFYYCSNLCQGLCVQNEVQTVISGFTATWTFYKIDFCILSSKVPYGWHKSVRNLVSSSDWLTKCLQVTGKRHRVVKIKRC